MADLVLLVHMLYQAYILSTVVWALGAAVIRDISMQNRALLSFLHTVIGVVLGRPSVKEKRLTISRFCLAQEVYLLASYCRGLTSVPVQVKWDMWWTNWHQDRIFFKNFGFPICIIYNIYDNTIFHNHYCILISHSIFRHGEETIISVINICRILSTSMWFFVYMHTWKIDAFKAYYNTHSSPSFITEVRTFIFL